MGELTERQIFKELCENDFSFFVEQYVKIVEPETKFVWNWHMTTLCHYAERVYYGDYQNLDINIPPRMMKSLILTVLFPCWVWTKDRSKKFICASRSYDLAISFNQKRRDLISSDAYFKLWPILIKDDMDTAQKFANYNGGFMMAASALGKITGTGADCFVGSTKVITDRGELSIGEIHDLISRKSLVKVLSYNHEKQRSEYKAVLGSRKTKSNKIVRTEFSHGRAIESTSDHRFFIKGRGYVEIQESYKDKDAEYLSVLQSEEGKDCLLLGLCELGSDLLYRGSVPKLLQSFQKLISRLQKEGKSWIKDISLLTRMCPRVREENKRSRQQMHWMRWSCSKKEWKTIQKIKNLLRLQDEGNFCEKVSSKFKKLQAMQKSVQNKVFKDFLLFIKLQKFISFERYEREKQSESQKNNKRGFKNFTTLFLKTIQRYKKVSNTLCILLFKRAFSCTSHRLGALKQFLRKSSCSLSDLSWISSPHQGHFKTRGTKAILQSEVSGEYEVFDIEVEGNHNFFAEGVLVHNCLLSDDLLDAVDAFSPAKREKVNLWYSNAFYNRAQDKKTVKRINVNQRLHVNDISGHLAETHNFHTLVLPMEAMESNPSTVDFVDPRKKGEFLFPARYDKQEADDDKKGLGVYGYSSQYQQTPRPIGGGIVKEEWIKRFIPHMIAKYETKIIVADLTFKGSKTSDYVSIQLWGRNGANKYLIDLIRGKWSYRETKEKFKEFCDKHNDVQTKWIEDKANGPALISDLKSEIVGLRAWPPQGSRYMNADKVQRLHLVSAEYEAGNVFIPTHIALADAFIGELTSFTDKGSATGNDDMVDTSTMALLELKQTKTFFG